MAYGRTLIKNGRVWTGTEFATGNILIEWDTIVSMHAPADTEADYVYDAEGCIVSAGLLDIHMHFYNVSTDKFGIPAEAICFPNGVTGAVDASAEKNDKAVLDAMLLKSRVFAITEVKDGVVNFDITERMLAAYGERAIGVKVYFDANYTPGITYENLKQICKFAVDRDLKVMVHCANSPTTMREVVEVLRKGDILTHPYHGNVNTILDDDFAAYKLAKEKGVIIDAGLAGNVHTNFRVLDAAFSAGCYPDTVSTDVTCGSAFNRGGNYGLCLCMSMMRAAGMNEEALLRSVTSDAAKAVGMENESGILAVGRKADIAVLAYSDGAFSFTDKEENTFKADKEYTCKFTVVNGQFVYRK